MKQVINKTVNTEAGKVTFSYEYVRTKETPVKILHLNELNTEGYYDFNINGNIYRVESKMTCSRNRRRDARSNVNRTGEWFYKGVKIPYDNFKKAIEHILKVEKAS